MSVFNRPMFRIPGVTNNQPSGIMSSGPNIMRASLISGANANPVQTGATNYVPNAPQKLSRYSYFYEYDSTWGSTWGW